MNRLTNQNLLQVIFVVLFLRSIPVFGQDSLKPFQFEKISLERAVSLNARMLSAAITNGKTTDKEKFDAILSWVVAHVRYDYRRYNSGKAFSSDHSLKRTLRRQKGICTDYTNLMDSLCTYAGLQNVTITGYVKEVNFDVKDELYFDNHAWSAVKLNGVWFLYDPTWCSGTVSWDYKRFAKWRLKMIRKLSKRTKSKELKFGSKIKNGSICDLPKETVYGSKTIHVVRFFPRVFIHVLSWFPFKVRAKYTGVANSEYYLANPEKFSVTHFPNNPIWALSKNATNVKEFAADPKSYNIPEYLAMNPSRHGTFCLECDDYEASGELERELKNYQASLRNNPNNHLLPGNYHLTMGGHLFQEVLKETDSLTKVHLMDSTQAYLLQARAHYKKAKVDARVEATFQVKKNTAKKYVLLKENRTDLAQVKKMLNRTAVKRNLVRALAVKSKSLHRTETNFLYKFNNHFKEPGPAKKMKDEQIQKVKQKIARSKFYCDSLTTEIQAIQTRFKSNLGVLWLNLREQEEVAVPLLNHYYTDGDMRLFKMRDSYKYDIRELRKKIAVEKQVLQNSVDRNILDMADSVCKDYVQMVKLVKKRDAAFSKNKRNFMLLRRANVFTGADVKQFCLETSETVQQTICWNSENELLVKSLVETFNYFTRTMRKSIQVIPWDSRMELKRHQAIEQHVRRNQMRNKDAVDNNAKLVSILNTKLHEHRRKFERKKII